MFNIVQDIVATIFLLGRGEEDGGQLFPGLGEFLLVGLHSLTGLVGCQFVGLGKDDGKGNAGQAEPLDELQVNLLRLQTDIDQHEDVDQLLALQNVAANHLVQLVHLLLGALGKTVAGKVDEIPLLIYNKVVDEQRLAWRGGGLRQLLVVGEHVDKTGLAHIGTTNEGLFGLGILRTHRHHRG